MMQNNSSLEIHNQKEVLFFVSCIIRSGGRGGARFVLRFLGEGGEMEQGPVLLGYLLQDNIEQAFLLWLSTYEHITDVSCGPF